MDPHPELLGDLTHLRGLRHRDDAALDALEPGVLHPLQVVFGGLRDESLARPGLEVSEDTGGGGSWAPLFASAGACAWLETAPRPVPAARAAVAVMNSRRLTDGVMCPLRAIRIASHGASRGRTRRRAAAESHRGVYANHPSSSAAAGESHSIAIASESYSLLNAIAGSIRAARRAGSEAAPMATSTRTPMAAAIAIGSVAVTS